MLIRDYSAVALMASLLALSACGKKEERSEAPPAVAEAVVVVDEEAVAEERDILIFMAGSRSSATATVEAIDLEARTVTLLPEGQEETITIMAPEEAHNLDQIGVGDTITAEYDQSISVEIVEVPEGTEPDAVEVVAGARAEKGETPAGGIMESQSTVSIVEAINLEDHTFKLKGPDGEVREYTAHNPENLELAEVGDAVVVTVTEAFAIALTGKAGDAEAAAD